MGGLYNLSAYKNQFLPQDKNRQVLHLPVFICQLQFGLFQDDVQGVHYPADTEEQNPQHQVDPEIFGDLVALVNVDCQRRNEQSEDDLQYFIIHGILLFLNDLFDITRHIIPFSWHLTGNSTASEVIPKAMKVNGKYLRKGELYRVTAPPFPRCSISPTCRWRLEVASASTQFLRFRKGIGEGGRSPGRAGQSVKRAEGAMFLF
jgi:hypothetical protein